MTQDRTARPRRDGFPAWAARNLYIRTKAGAIAPLRLNAVQRSLHARIEDQKRRTGRVRALILKARQPGVSTYVEARFYRQVIGNRGVRAFILTHLRNSTDAIFEMVERFHDRNRARGKPHIGASNAKELWFDEIDSGYRVGTAGSKAIGRGHTLQYFHGSEVAHWPNAAAHMAGVMQAVPDLDGSEVILESTANGIGGLFYDMCKAAERGEGEYELIFIPWFAHDEYRATPPATWVPPASFAEYGDLHGLDGAGLYWAWRRNAGLAQACRGNGDEICWMFRQEYPATAEEAFQASGHDSLIRSELVVRARKHTAADQAHAPLVLGIDIARGGGDRTHIIDRQGRIAGSHINRSIDSADLMEVAGIVGREIDRLRPDHVFIDGTGIGAGVYDRLRERGYRRITLVNFGARPEDGRKFANKRAEMWGLMAEWFGDEAGADIIDDDALHAQLTAPGYSFDSDSRLLLEKKDRIKSRTGFSPDAGDALALTFAGTVRRGGAQPVFHSRADSDYDPLGY